MAGREATEEEPEVPVVRPDRKLAEEAKPRQRRPDHFTIERTTPGGDRFG